MNKLNIKRVASILTICIMVFSMAFAMTGCGSEEESGLTKITFCLDWTPNTNHTGIYAAQAQGWYEEAGLEVEIVQPPENGAAHMCASGEAQFAIEAQDTMAASLALDEPLGITAVAGLIQHNTSGIMSRAGDGIDTPKGLTGRTYSTWDSPIELAMLENVVDADGGDFDKVKLIPNDITDEPAALSAKQTDAVWVFEGWSKVNAQVSGVDVDYFAFSDIDPTFDYYTPVIIANNDFLAEDPETAKAFLAATARGYEFAVENPEEAADMLIAGDNTGSLAEAEDLVKASQKFLSPLYIDDADRWGVIDAARWNGFYKWLYENELCAKDLTDIGFSNEYLPE
ncbi:MAG: ABC transporter substrate-binding protein [Firmicutes bacterium]|nr:ABC transporter substrate-binding protein [Bacillota bacterium]MBR3787922.1 ABC transporter substrate-binding protein [Bacillota bacterium]